MVAWQLQFIKQAQQDAQKLKASRLKTKATKSLEILAKDPYTNSPPYENLVGDLAGAYSRRINIQHRLIYQVLKQERVVKIIRLWTHYE